MARTKQTARISTNRPRKPIKKESDENESPLKHSKQIEKEENKKNPLKEIQNHQNYEESERYNRKSKLKDYDSNSESESDRKLKKRKKYQSSSSSEDNSREERRLKRINRKKKVSTKPENDVMVNQKTKEEWKQENLNNFDFQVYNTKWGPFEAPDIEVDWKKIIKERTDLENQNNDEIYKNMMTIFKNSFEEAQSNLSIFVELLDKSTNKFKLLENNQNLFSNSSKTLNKDIKKMKDESSREILTKLSKSYYYDYENTIISHGLNEHESEDDFIHIRCIVYSIITGLPVKLNLDVKFEPEYRDGEIYYDRDTNIKVNVYGEKRCKNLSLQELSNILIGKKGKKENNLMCDYIVALLVAGVEDRVEDDIRDQSTDW